MELEPIWATLLEKALAGKNVKELLLNVGAGGGAPAAGSAALAAGGAAAAEAPKEEEKKEEEKEESDDDMVRFLAYVSSRRCLMFWVCRASDCSINCFAIVYTCHTAFTLPTLQEKFLNTLSRLIGCEP